MGFCLMAFATYSQTYKPADPAIEQQIRTADQADYLSQTKKEVIYYSNWVRVAPQSFMEEVLLPYLKENPQNPPELRSLKRELKNMAPVSVLIPDKKLTAMARSHAKDLGPKGKLGHTGSRRQTLKERAEKLWNYQCLGC